MFFNEMGFGVLDSDDSNQSSLVSNVIASFAPPSSALSMIPPDTSGDESDLAEPFSETESIIENNENMSQHTTSDIHLSSNEANSLPTLYSSGSKESNLPTDLKINQFHQDFTPATLIPCTRTSFRGIINSVENPTNAEKSTSFGENVIFTSPPEGRAIRGNSMKQFHKEQSDCDSPMKHKGRSPLAAIGNATPLQVSDSVDQKKTLNNDDCFFMYQRRDPRLYTGEDNFAKLSDEILLSIFKWLPKKTLSRCSLVNQRFHRVTQDESLWTRLDLAGKTIQPHALGRILMRGTIILRLAQCKVMQIYFVLTYFLKFKSIFH